MASRMVFRRPPSISPLNLISLMCMAFLLLIVCAITFPLVRQGRRNREATQRSSAGKEIREECLGGNKTRLARMALVPPTDGR